jgi:hypothetical protein
MRWSRPARISSLALGACALSVGCGYPDYRFVTADEDAVADGAEDVGDDTTIAADAPLESAADAPLESAADAVTDALDAPDAPLPTGSCPSIVLGQILANTVSMQPISTPIVVDGDGGEWCSLRAFRFDSAASNWLEPDPLPSWAASASARIRLAWFAGADAVSSGLYLDAIVSDSALHVAPAGSDVDQGASLTLYVGAVSPLTGAYDGVADQGATAFVLAPPQGALPARGAVDIKGVQAHGLPAGVLFKGREVVGGYELEAMFPWSVIAKGGTSAPVPVLGQTIGLDLVLRVRDASGTKVRLIWRAGLAGSTTCPTDPLPECDDRTWYTPKLGM